MSAGMRVQGFGVEREICHVIRNVGLQFQSADRLITNLELRHFNQGLHLGITKCPFSAGIHFEHTQKLQISCLQCLQLVELDAGSMQLRIVGLACRFIENSRIRGARGKIHLQICRDLFSCRLKLHIHGPDRLACNPRRGETECAMARRSKLGAVGSNVGRERAGNGRGGTSGLQQILNVDLRR